MSCACAQVIKARQVNSGPLSVRTAWGYRSTNFRGFERERLSKYQKFSGLPLIIFIGQDWTLTCRCGPYGVRMHFHWFRAR